MRYLLSLLILVLLAGCTADTLPETAESSLRQMKADQQTARALLQSLGYPVASGVRVQHNRVEVMITDPAGVEAALAAAGAELPPSVVFDVVYKPVGDPPPFPITPLR